MARILLLADSNFVNNIGAYKGKRIKDLEVKSCQSRKAVMSELANVEEGIVVLACLDMVAADISGSSTSGADQAVDYYYSQMLYKLSEKVDESDGKIAFGIVAPLFWTSLSNEVKRAMNHSYKTMKITPMVNIWCSEYHRDVKAGADGTHLTQVSAAKYIKHVHDLFELVSKNSKINLLEWVDEPGQTSTQTESTSWAEEEGTDQEAVNSLAPPEDQNILPPSRTATMLSASMLVPPARTDTMLSASMLQPMRSQVGLDRDETAELQARLLRMAAAQDFSVPPPLRLGGHHQASGFYNGGGQLSVENRLRALEAQAFYNNLTTAALKEELDTEANKAMLNRVTVSGVVIDGIEKMTDTVKIPAMKSKIEEIFESIKEQDQSFEVVFVRHLNKQVRGQKSSVIEVKLADEKQAKELRAEFVKKFKSFDKINITPVVRLATRVRIEIMHSICFYLKRQDSSVVKASCLQFVPKPVIKVVRKSFAGTEVTRTMTFIDGLNWVKESGLLGRMDLTKARNRAGSSFRGTLAQHFVLFD